MDKNGKDINMAVEQLVPQLPIEKTSVKATVYAVVVTYNGTAWIKDCLDSLIFSDFPINVVVVDNASTDETSSIVTKFDGVTLIQESTNFGFGQANNIGIRYALEHHADYVFLLNQDAWISPKCISKLVNCAERTTQFGILSPIHLNAEGSKLDSNFLSYLLRSTSSKFFSDIYFEQFTNEKSSITSVYQVDFINAAAWLVSSDCLKRVGGFDPLFFMYKEDRDFCERVLFHGYKIGFVPTARIYHARNNASDFVESCVGNRNATSKNPVRVLSEMTFILKQRKSTFAGRLISLYISSLREILRTIRKSNWLNLLILIISLVKVHMQIHRIMRHRKVSEIVGSHWI